MNQDNLYREVGARIRARRVQLKKTQEELAREIQLSRPSLANIEMGRQNILLHQLYRISVGLGLNPSDLLPVTVNQTSEQHPSVMFPANLSDSQQQQIKAFLTTSPVKVREATAIRRDIKG